MAVWAIGADALIGMGAWALIMVFAVWLLIREPHRDDRDDPAAILRARFARGEITEEEYRRATAALTSDPRQVHR